MHQSISCPMEYQRYSCASVYFPASFCTSHLLSVVSWKIQVNPCALRQRTAQESSPQLDGWIFSPSPVRFVPACSLVQRSSLKHPDRPFLPILLQSNREEAAPIPSFKNSNGHPEMPSAIDTSGSKIVRSTYHTSGCVSVSFFRDLDGSMQATVVERCRT